jgi:hypothetical protein
MGRPVAESEASAAALTAANEDCEVSFDVIVC